LESKSDKAGAIASALSLLLLNCLNSGNVEPELIKGLPRIPCRTASAIDLNVNKLVGSNINSQLAG
jgi:hypothetical protein